MRSSSAYARVVARTEKRLADLEAVRDGRAVEVYATVAINRQGQWASHGHFESEPTADAVLRGAQADRDDKLTVVRSIAYKPSHCVVETEGESEDA